LTNPPPISKRVRIASKDRPCRRSQLENDKNGSQMNRFFHRVFRSTRALLTRKAPLVISCAELDQFIVDYLDRKLSVWQWFKFRFHLLGCRTCRAYLDGYKKTIALGKKAFVDPVKPAADEAPEELVRAILAARRR
jgi:hypothetical protein